MILVSDTVRVALVRVKNAKGFVDQCMRDQLSRNHALTLEANQALYDEVDKLIKSLPPEAQSL